MADEAQLRALAGGAWFVKEKSRKSLLGWHANKRWFKVERLQKLVGDELALCYYKASSISFVVCPL